MQKKLWLYPVTSGLLLSLPWLFNFPGIILSVAFLPLLQLGDYFRKHPYYSQRSVFLYFLPAFFIWQLLSIWWVGKVTFAGALFAIFVNSLFGTSVFWLAHYAGIKSGPRMGQIAFVSFWLAFEYISLHIDFAVPWMVMGNSLSNVTYLVQWFEYTGVLGGSAWLLMLNLLVFNALKNYIKRQFVNVNVYTGFFLLLLIVMSVISVALFKVTNSPKKQVKVGLIQPNIDPFTQKFSGLTQEEQLFAMLHLADSISNKDIQYYVAPETAIDDNIWEDAFTNNQSVFAIQQFLKSYPNSTFVFGAITKKEINNANERTLTTRFDSKDSVFYEVYNSAIQIDSGFDIQVYHKSKLVLGVEKAPFLKLFKFLGSFTIPLGGEDGSFGQQEYPTLFENKNTGIYVAPVICYESVFGEHINGFVKKGANVIFLITNDGWWGGSLGYLQHFNYARLRAIETRRSIVRCANTGISGFIDNRGQIIASTKWWTKTAITGSVGVNEEKTFYVLYGDYIGRIALFLSICYLLVLATVVIRSKYRYIP